MFDELEQALSLPQTDNDYLHRWFAPQALQELLVYRETVEKGGYQYKDLMRVVLSRSARSARLTTHFDLDFPKAPQNEPYYCYKHARECKPTSESVLKESNKFSPAVPGCEASCLSWPKSSKLG